MTFWYITYCIYLITALFQPDCLVVYYIRLLKQYQYIYCITGSQSFARLPKLAIETY